MIEDLDQSTILILNVLYEKLVQSMTLANKRLLDNSIFLTLLKLTSNDTYKIIRNASFKFEKAFYKEITNLESLKYVSKPDDKEKLDELVITAHGIWYIESTKGIIELNDVLNYIQDTKLEFPKAKLALVDSEKVIIYSLLAIRTFSDVATMDLNSPDLCNKWQDIIENIIIPHLRESKIIKLESVIDKKTGTEDPISYLMRHANNLPQKTNNLFVPTKKNKYYLSLNTNHKGKGINQVSFLLNKIIPKIDSIQMSSNLLKFLCDVAHNQSLYVTPTFEFITNSWDQILKESLEQLYLGLDISSYVS
jgi:hypothetical protein